MSVRTVKVAGVAVGASGAVVGGVVVKASLLGPAGVTLVDTAGELIAARDLATTSDPTSGAFTFDPAASPTNGLIAPGDVRTYVAGVLTAVAGCSWRITFLATALTSDSFAYTASTINPATWASAPSTLGLIKCYLTGVYGSGAPIPGRGFTVALSGDAFWTGGAGAGQRIPGGAAFPLTADAAGTIALYVIRQSELNPSTGAWQVKDSVNGGISPFQAPSTYGAADRGVYAGGTTYALGDIARRPADDEPFVSLAGGNTGNALTDATKWAVYPGINVESILTALGPPGQVALTAATIGHDADVPALIDDPVQAPATLGDDLHNLAGRTAFAVRAVAGAYTATAADDYLLADATGGAFAVTLPAATGRVRPLVVIRTNGGANNVTIQRAGADTINGATSYALTTRYQVAALKSDTAAAWYVGGTAGAAGGSSSFSWATKTANYAVAGSDSGILADGSGGGFTVTLPSAAGIAQVFAVKKQDASVNAIAVATTSSQTIDGQTTRVLAAQGATIYVASDGANWYEVAALAEAGFGAAGQIPGVVGGDLYWIYPSGLGGPVPALQQEGDLLYRRKVLVSSLAFGFIGDSITQGSGVSPAPPATCAADLSTASATVAAVNQGVGGSKTADWLSGGTNLTSAKAAFGGPAATPVVHIMLGTNDSIAGVAAATYRANLRSTVNDLVGAGYIVALSYPIYGTGDGIGTALLVAYQAQINSLVNGHTVLLGDTSGYLAFQAKFASWFQGDNVHPNQAGANALGRLWANALARTAAALSEQTTLARLAVGANGQVLAVSSGYPAWQNNPAGFANPMAAAGDLILGGALGAAQRLAKGADGQVLTLDPATHLPLWAAPSSGFADPTTTKGDLIVHGSATTRLGVGSDGQVLTAASAAGAGMDWESPVPRVPLVTGDTPGPVFVVTGDGQCVMS